MFRGINASRRDELKKYISENAVLPAVRSVTFPWLMTGSIAATLFVLVALYYRNDIQDQIFTANKEMAMKPPAKQRMEPPAASSDAADETAASQTDTLKSAVASGNIAFTPPVVIQEELQEESDKESITEGAVDQTSQLSPEDYYSIKGDEFLGDTIMMVQEKNADIEKDGRRKAEERYDDSAQSTYSWNYGNPAPKTLQVEFWRSPINYKGYRFSSKKLLLFGLPDNNVDAVIQLDGNWYLKDGSRYYKLERDDKFNSYIAVTDTNILNRLKN